VKRVIVDVLLLVGVFVLFAFELHEMLSPPLQLIFLKVLLISAGVLHAHIVRKLLFPKVDWELKELKGNVYASIAFYITIPICYALGG
jgi:hypothetical protein